MSFLNAPAVACIASVVFLTLPKTYELLYVFFPLIFSLFFLLSQILTRYSKSGEGGWLFISEYCGPGWIN